MATKIEMPKLSDTMTEGTVVRWLKKVGDQIEIGDEIAEIETDKATMAMEAFDEGILAEILIEDGGKATIGATLAVLREEGEASGQDEAAAEPAPASEPAGEKKESSEKAPAGEEAEAAAKSAPAPDPADEKKESSEKEPAREEAKSPEKENASQESPPAEEAPEEAAPAAQKAAPASGKSEKEEGRARIKASPLARKIAAAAGVDLATLTGTGPGGRIVKKDVEAASGAAPSAPAPQAEAPAPAQAAQTPSRPAPITPVASGKDRRIELSNLRRIIAERLLTSKTTIPHFYLHVEADAAPLMEIRRQVNAQAEATHGNKYTVNDFVLKAVINALQAVPAANASFNGDHIVQYAHIGIAVAVAVEDGLVTPVVKEAASKSLLQISREVKDFAARAREGKLLPNEFDGGTITVSNLGAYGVEFFDAIINPPQAAILSVGAIVEKPVVVDGAVVPGLRMNLGVSGDHRVVDGAVGAQFLGEVKKLIENPALMLV